MKFNMKKAIAMVTATSLVVSGLTAGTAQAAKKVKLNKKSVTLGIGKSVKLKLKNAKKKVKWSSKNKKVATVNKKGKVTAKKAGTTKIVAKSAGKKYVCKVLVKGEGQSNTPSSTRQPDSTKKPSSSTATAKPDATQKPGTSTNTGDATTSSSQTKPSSCAEDTLGIGKMTVTLGMSKSEVEKNVGAKPDREEKAPTGYDVYIYNPSSDYTNYLMLQFDGDSLVGISTISAYFCYESLFSAGDTADSLRNAGFKSMTTRYDYEQGYLYEGSNEYAMAFVDHQGSKEVYAAQIFSKTKELDQLFKAENLTYDETINSYMRVQLFDWVNAFRAYKGASLASYCNLDGAQKHSDSMAESGTVDQGSDWKERFNQNYFEYAGLVEGDTLGKGENNGGRSPDAFGFVTWWIDDTDSISSDGEVKTYSNISKSKVVFNGVEENLTGYYLCTGFSYNGNQSDVTYATLDFFY